MSVENPERDRPPVLDSPKISFTPTLPIVCLNEPINSFVLKLFHIGFLSLVDKDSTQKDQLYMIKLLKKKKKKYKKP